MLSVVNSFASASMARIAYEQQRHLYEEQLRRQWLAGRSFSCGPWRWRILAYGHDIVAMPITKDDA